MDQPLRLMELRFVSGCWGRCPVPSARSLDAAFSNCLRDVVYSGDKVGVATFERSWQFQVG